MQAPRARSRRAAIAIAAAAVALLVASGRPVAGHGPQGRRISCDVAVIGGGSGGLHTAYRLGRELGSRVCLFEKEERLGGRILDVSRDPGGPVYGTGALRVMEGQPVVLSLAGELGIPLEQVPYRDQLISARGYFGHSSDELNALAYPLVDDATGETDLYDTLRHGPQRPRAGGFPDLRSYMRAVIGSQGYQFLADVSRFRAEFDYAVSAPAYLEYLDEEWDLCCDPHYPVGGMSQFIRRMEDRATRDGVRIFRSEPVRAISREHGRGRRYSIVTPRYEVSADRVVIAVDANGFRHVRGGVAEAIQAQPQFRDLLPVKVVTVTQWWPRAWWLDQRGPHQVRRAWTTEHCLNALEIPVNHYAARQLVTRSVYDDDRRCVEFWVQAAERGISSVEGEIRRGLGYLFPELAIPDPLATHVQVWPAGWYFLRGGSPFSNAQIARWAVEPLPGESVCLVGESYNPQRSGWMDAAIKSSANALHARYGFDLPRASNAPAQRRSRRDPGRAGRGP